MVKKISIVLPLLLAVVLTARLEAQQRDPNAFFPRGFVNGDQPVSQGEQPAPANSSYAVSVPQLQLKDEDVHENFQAGLNASVLINSRDKEHFDVVYRKLLTLHKRGRMRIVFVEYIGSYQNVSDTQREELLHEGITVVPTRALPTDIVVNTSPTWRVNKGNDTYVIEGFYAPERFFTASGAFVPPIGMEVEALEDERADAELKDF